MKTLELEEVDLVHLFSCLQHETERLLALSRSPTRNIVYSNSVGTQVNTFDEVCAQHAASLKQLQEKMKAQILAQQVPKTPGS